MSSLPFRRLYPAFALPLSVLVGATATPVVNPARASAPRPLVQIVSGPASRTVDREVLFEFKTRTRAATTACRLDDRAYRPCRTRVKFTGLRLGGHKFTVRARIGGRTKYTSRRWSIAWSKRHPGPLTPFAHGFGSITTDPATGGPAPGARLVFADEFNGTTLDRSAWDLYDGAGHGGSGLRRPSAFSLDGRGRLVVTAKTVGGQTVSGGMANRLNFTYGRVEFRVKSEPDPTGTMNAVVLTWPEKQWSPDFTENDMYETGPTANNRHRFDSYIHFGVQNYQHLTTHRLDPTRWRTIAMDWNPGLLEIYVDGNIAFSISDPAVIPDVLHHVTIQLDAMSKRKLARPVRMWVDYVRIYQ